MKEMKITRNVSIMKTSKYMRLTSSIFKIAPLTPLLKKGEGNGSSYKLTCLVNQGTLPLLKKERGGVRFEEIAITTLILLFCSVIGYSQITTTTTTTISTFNISVQPDDQTVCSGSSATFKVIALAVSGTLSYQWQYATTSTGTYTNITGATSSTYSITGSSTINGRYYKCKVTSSDGSSKTSFSAKLTVNTAIAITTQPANQTVCSGTRSFSVAATGGSLTYQWQYKTSALAISYTNITGATAATYSLTASTSNNGYYYRCVVSNTCGSVNSSAAKLTVNATTAISTHPVAQTVCSGDTAKFSVVATGSALTYQWKYASTATATYYPITSATSATYSVVANSYNNGYYYKCEVSGTCGLAVTSTAAKLTLSTAPVITTNPNLQAICLGSAATFSVVATGSGLTYQWQFSPGGLVPYSNITGATAATYSFTPSTIENSYDYKCKVSNSCGSILTAAAKLLVMPSIAIAIQPSNQIAKSGSSATFSVTIGSGSNVTYQWQKSTTAGGTSYSNISGATSSSYTFTTADADNNFNYRCQLSGSCGPVVTSSAASLTLTKTVSYKVASTGSKETVSVPVNIQKPSDVSISLLNRATGKNRKVPGVDYSYSNLNSFVVGTAVPAFYSDFLYLCQSSCLPKILNSYKLVAVLNTGDVYNYGTTAFNADVSFSIKDQTGAIIKSISLHIDQNNPEQVYQIEIDPAAIAFVNNLQQLSISMNSAPVVDARVQSNLHLKVYFDTDYGMDVAGENIIITTTITSPVSSNPVKLSWTTTASCSEKISAYEIQVLRLYNTSNSYISNPEAMSTIIDWSQALSILTESSATSYTLTLGEGNGYYTWRVRAIGDYYENGAGNSENWGEWSTAYIDGYYVNITAISALTADQTKYVFYYNQFDTDKNWIYNRVLTEEGKVSENIVYADGLGLAKQKQHKMQGQNQIIAGVNISDYVGRESVITMSAPINQNKLQYVDILAQDANGGFYGPEDFDSDKRITKDRYPVCAGDAVNVPLWENPSEMYGPISDYFSDSNEDINIPNAENYPYSRTVFHKDGRQKKTSLYGGEHRMGLYDETYMLGGLQRTVRTYYSAVSDTELIKVFGNETPADTGVYKIVKVDPNEVATVEYKTLEGKTIATCMVNTGDHPLLEDISENKDTITKEIKGNLQKDPYTLLKEQVITFTDPTVQLNVDYLLNKKEFEANCINYCSTCDYIIDLYIIREETDEVKWSDTYTLKPGACGGNLAFEMNGDRSDTLFSNNSEPCPQMVLSTNSAGIIMLSDPGNYRIGRKITVNGKYDGEARYRDYHADTISKKLDKEAAKFDTLFGYLNEESGDLMALYDYLDSLSLGSTSACDDETAESGSSGSFDFSARFGSALVSRLGSGSLLSGTTLKGKTISSSNDIWQVSYEEGDEEGYGTYTLASSCLEIEVPKIPCDFNPCDALWKTSGSETWQTNLIAKYGGYYDYEKVLTDKWSTTIFPGETSAIGTDLYKYFKDKYGNYKYPTNADGKAVITITATNPSSDSRNNGKIWIRGGNTNVPDAYIKVNFSFNGSSPVEWTFQPIPTDPIHIGGYVVPIYEYRNDGTIKEVTYSTIRDQIFIYADEFADQVASQLKTNLNLTTGFNYTVTVEDISSTQSKIYISTDYSHGESALHSISKSGCNGLTSSVSNFRTSTESTFPWGNGAFNSMVTHMIMEDVDGSSGDVYDCYNMFMIWEDIVNDYESLRLSMSIGAGPGLDLLEYFLEKTGKEYRGYSNHEYGRGDANAYLTSTGITVADFGYGYLEYAYKSFELDIPLSTNANNCLDIFGVKVDDPISTWDNPDNGINDNSIEWNETTCGSAAWWNGSSVIADKISESDECKAWNGLYECLNADLELYAGSLSNLTGMRCSNTPDEGCINAFSTYLYDRTIDVLNKRDMNFTNAIRLSVGVSDEEASAYTYNLINYLGNELSLTVQKDSDGNITGLGSSDELGIFYNLHNKGLKVSTTDPVTSTSSAATTGKFTVGERTVKRSKMIADELTNSFRNSESITSSEIENKLGSIYNKYGWSKASSSSTPISSKISSVLATRTTPIARHATKSNISFSAVGGIISVKNIDTGTDELSMEVSTLSAAEDADVVIGPMTYQWGDELKAVKGVVQSFNVAKDCDSRNLTYVANKINYALDEAKECRLEKSLAEYDEQCTLPSNIDDVLKISYTIDYHQYTLFYYDVAGNLIKTVPPQGVDIASNAVKPSRQDLKNHQYLTKYKYNSLGQRTYEETPDGGVKHFYYNNIGQLRFAQNEKQAADNVYEYYKYDALGRLTEAGLSSLGATDNLFADNVESATYPTSNRTERMVSVYGSGSTANLITYLDGVTEQHFLENRMKYSYSDADGIANNGDEIYTYYSYDIHGNVEWMASSIPGVAMKYIAYEYDLITQKVKEVKYNEGKTDQFFHRYNYDADNRIIAVETSRDGVIWDVEARYEYYAYGSMKRLSYGEDNVNGLDYVYTINGWLKAVNHQSLNSFYDPGKDGTAANTYGKDVFGMTLGYFDGDFKRKYGSTASVFNSEFNDVSSPYYNTGINQLSWDYDNVDRAEDAIDNTKAFDYRPLFNGSITNVSYATQSVAGSTDPYNGKIKGMKYKYDELYRLTESSFDYFKTTDNVWARTQAASTTALKDYNTSYTYDLAGNIETLNRYGDGGLMDKLVYHYEDKDANGVKDNNRLEYVTDGVSNSSYPYAYDLETQSTGNYTYDEVGELIGDAAENIKSIEWTRTAKVKKVIKEVTGTLGNITHTEISFTYNGMDKRVSKTVSITKKYGTSGAITTSEITYYMLDGKGQVMSIYTTDGSTDKLSEQIIYSSDRLGMDNPDESVTLATNTDELAATTFTRTLGKKSYEIKDFLGNVRAVVSDVKELNADGTFSAKLLSSNDYMPYGMLMPHSDNSSSDYRYGYQGMEKDPEIKDGGNSYDFGARILDPRIGRWLSMDPLAAQFPDKSPYNAMGNDPINKIDPDGRSEDNLVSDHSASYDSQHAFDNMTPEAAETMREVYLFPVEIGLGFTPAGVALDAKDMYLAYLAGSRLGMALAAVGYLPFGDIAKPVVKGVWRSVGSNSIQAGVDLLQKAGIDPSAIAKINTKFSGAGDNNCMLATLSMDEYLASGKAWSVDGSHPGWKNPETFANQAGVKVSDFRYAKAIDDVVLQEGDRAIVWGGRGVDANGNEVIGHVFNVAKIDGQNVFIDAQLGRVIDGNDIAGEGYKTLHYAITGKIGDR